jgi:hypothetical protein
MRGYVVEAAFDALYCYAFHAVFIPKHPASLCERDVPLCCRCYTLSISYIYEQPASPCFVKVKVIVKTKIKVAAVCHFRMFVGQRYAIFSIPSKKTFYFFC